MENNSHETQNKGSKNFYKLVWFWLAMGSIVVAIIFLVVGTSAQAKVDTANKKIHSMKKSYSEGESVEKKFNTYIRNHVPNYESYVSNAADYALGDLDENSTESTDESSSSTTTDTSYTFGETANFSSTTDDTDIEVTVISANVDTAVTLNDGEAGNKPLVVTIKIKNTGTSAYDFNIQDFNAFDADGNTLNFDSNTYENTMPDSVNAGQTVSTKAYFDATSDGPFIVTFADGTWK
ncbi:DUF4352 domain-containing protein [Lactococcus nasutitermitis]|uniref:DUF4352 domain-containing protein n=1 Tax=Lactococcus nasutitermitis TaxID=1652957 RepID=A0ABV9JCY7_9LACT|nr:DUF4352 domain-containing protein [Lactococcus nasutitermitis]